MKQVRTAEDIKRLGTILGVWAHPDDETFTMGGIMATAVKNGQTVAIITATRGELGIQDESRWPAAQLAKIRTKELDAAYKILGVKHHYWLDYPDGGCTKINQKEAVERIAELIKMYQPDSILSFGPEGMTGHKDHQRTSQWARAAAKQAGSTASIYHAILTNWQYDEIIEADKRFNIFFNIKKPPVCKTGECAIHYHLSDDIYHQKLAAFKAMPSQQEGMMRVFGDSLRVSLGTEAFTPERDE